MARDKKRPKRGAPKPEDSQSPRARDMNIDDSSIDDAGITDPVAAPDPLKNSSAEVDQAKAAETGAVRGESGDVEMGRDARAGDEDPEPGPPEDSIYDEPEDGSHEDSPDFEHAPDELERDLAPALAGRDAAGSMGLDPAVAAEAAHPRKQRGRVLTFLGHCVDELRRVQWPDRRQTGQATAVTLGFVVIAGGFLGLMDALWRPLVNALI